MDRFAHRKRKEVPQQPEQPGVRVFTGDELGLVRAADVPAGLHWEGTQVAARWGEPDKTKAVTVLAVSSPEGMQPLLAVGRASGEIDILEASHGVHAASIGSCTEDKDSAKIVGLAFLPPSADESSSKYGGLVSCSANGTVRIMVCVDGNDAAGTSGRSWEERVRFQTCSNAACMAVDASGQYVAVGGEGCHMQVWSLEKQKAVYKAKGGKPNMVGLVDPPYITSLAFIPTNTTSQPSVSDSQGEGDDERLPLRVLAGTAKHKLWLYDLMVGKRPQMDLSWNETRITALAPEASGKRVWVANGLGVMEALDVAVKKVCSGGLKGAGGSVRALQLHSELPVVAAVGLDRFMRLYDTNTRKCLCKVYMKQQLTAVAFGVVPAPPSADDQAQAEAQYADGTREDDEEQEDVGAEQPHIRKRPKTGNRDEREGKSRSKASKGRSKGQ